MFWRSMQINYFIHREECSRVLTNTKLKKLCSNWESAFNKLSGERFKLQNYMTYNYKKQVHMVQINT